MEWAQMEGTIPDTDIQIMNSINKIALGELRKEKCACIENSCFP